MAPPADRVPTLMHDLLRWLRTTDQHPLVTSSVFHYEFEFIYPFADGNGRVGRLWQTLILTRWNPLFAHIPVESLVHEHQAEYYQALQNSTDQTDSAPFIEFMLRMILDAVSSAASPKSHPRSPLKSSGCLRYWLARCPGRISRTRSACRTANHSANATSSLPWRRV